MGTIAATSIVNNVFGASEYIEKEKATPDGGKFTLPMLPYNYDALEPHIDKLTMEIHHSKHHQGYVTNLNKALETVDGNVLGSPQSFENIFDKVAKLPTAVRNNAGGHYNHSLFWILMKPNAGGQPKGKLAAAINASFGSFDGFKTQFTDASMKRFGSGWSWLVVSKGKLVITSTANQDNPLMNLDSIEVKGTPIIALDVWEHAYYLKNQNRRAEYIASWWNVLNWDAVESLFAAVK
ncbi:MAG: superoxide dismutase [Bacteroidetes bacterium]|nr:superoxide dismutase [Bacteroidota bacterium]